DKVSLGILVRGRGTYRKRQFDFGDIFVPDLERPRIEHRLFGDHGDMARVGFFRAVFNREFGVLCIDCLHIFFEVSGHAGLVKSDKEEKAMRLPVDGRNIRSQESEIPEARRNRVSEVRAKTLRVALAFSHRTFSAAAYG